MLCDIYKTHSATLDSVDTVKRFLKLTALLLFQAALAFSAEDPISADQQDLISDLTLGNSKSKLRAIWRIQKGIPLGDAAITSLADLLGSEDPAINLYSENAIVGIGSSALPSIEKLFKKTEKDTVKLACLRCLSRMAGPDLTDTEVNRVIELVRPFLGKQGDMCSYTEACLSKIGQRSTVTVKDLLHGKPEEKASALRICAKFEKLDLDLVPLLEAELKSSDANLKFLAIHALASSPAPTIAAHIAGNLAHDSSQIRVAAGQVLNDMGDLGIKAAVALLDKPELDAQLREKALVWLSYAGTNQPACTELLIQLLDGHAEDIESAVVRAIGHSDTAAPKLLEVLPKASDRKRQRILTILKSIHPPKVSVLTTGLEGRQEDVCLCCVQMLKRIKERPDDISPAYPALRRLLESPSEELRKKAAELLPPEPPKPRQKDEF
jgi:hypothetical protein